MQSLYRPLLQVEIRHDYFQLPIPGARYLADYDVSTFIEIIPSQATEKLMRDHRMRLKNTRTGFTIFVEADFISAAIGFASLIDAEPNLYFSFYWILQDHRLLNYTNYPLRETTRSIYYFSNRTASQQGGITYLNQPIPPFGATYPNETVYHLGDIVSQGGQSFEMIEMESPAINFPANINKWQSIDAAITNYVNPFDRLKWQSAQYHHLRNNNTPGEFISYQLQDANGIAVPLQTIPGTNLSQSEYRAPLASAAAVDHTLSLDHLKPGKYTLTINEVGGPTLDTFYLLNDTLVPNLFAVSEFFVSGAAAPFQFIANNIAINRWILDDPAKNFLIRFRPRLTRWKYLKQDQTVFHQAPTLRPLTKTFSNYSIVVGPDTINLPDPAVDPIFPDIDAPTKLLKNIFSQIFLIN
jgi:hypothetical protein